jgi:NAD(P) transhydrogenase subunit alpha
MRIGVPLETRANETRVAATPETVKKFIAQGHTVVVQSNAGLASSQPDSAYQAVGATIGSAADALSADLVLKVRAPEASELAQMNSNAVLLGMLDPFDNANNAAMAAKGITAFALEAAPRTTRAQSLDVLSSQANIAGYKAVMVAANEYQRFMPMLMTAAGTVKAARVLILGAGVAGLQAIATAKGLGAVIEASDVPKNKLNLWVLSLWMFLMKPKRNAKSHKALVVMPAQCQPLGCNVKQLWLRSAPSRLIL